MIVGLTIAKCPELFSVLVGVAFLCAQVLFKWNVHEKAGTMRTHAHNIGYVHWEESTLFIREDPRHVWSREKLMRGILNMEYCESLSTKVGRTIWGVSCKAKIHHEPLWGASSGVAAAHFQAGSIWFFVLAAKEKGRVSSQQGWM